MARRSSLLSPTAFVRRSAVYKGLLGGSRGWLAAGGVLWFVRGLKRTLGRSETIAATEVLKPGQFVTIEALKPVTRRTRRATKKAAAKRP